MHTEILQIFYSKATRLKDISTLELKLIKIISNELKKLESNDLLPLSNRKVLFNYQFIQILSKRNEFIKNSITAYNLTKKLKKKKLISSKSIMYPKNIKFFSTNPLDSSFLYLVVLIHMPFLKLSFYTSTNAKIIISSCLISCNSS